MSENYCPSCGPQKSYGRTLAYYPDGPDLNKNICSKCGQTLISADATIATLQRENEALRKERDGVRDEYNAYVKESRTLTGEDTDTIFALRAEIATLQAQAAQLRAALDELLDEQLPCDEPFDERWCSNHGNKGCEMKSIVGRARAVLAQTPTESLERYNAMARACEAAQELRMLGPVPGRDVSNIVPALAEVESAIRKLDAALDALAREALKEKTDGKA